MQTQTTMQQEDDCNLLTALLIEDNADDAEFLSKHLKRVKQQKIQLNHCETLTSGLQRLAKGGIDIVFLDLSLADSVGLDTVAKVRKEYSTIPVVVLTGSDDDDLAVRVLKTGAQDYLVKGQVDPSSLGRSIKYAIERQQTTDVLQWMVAVVNGSNDAIIAFSNTGAIVSWNRGAEQIFNYSSGEVLGRHIEEYLPSNVVNAALLIDRCQRNEKMDPYEVTSVNNDGKKTIVFVSTSPIIDGNGVMTGVSLIAHDLTQQRLTEQVLRETAIEATKRRDQIFNDIVAYAPIGIVISDSRLQITTVNSAFSSMIQKEQPLLLGRLLTEVLPSQARTPVEKAVAIGEQLQLSRLQVTIPGQRATAAKYWDLSLWPVTNDRGETIEVVMQVFDCTATVLLEQQRDDFVASVAHDIKNPLIGAERMFSVLCEQATDCSDEISTKMLTVLRDGNQNLLSLVQNLVDVYRYETVAYPCHFEDTDLNSVILSCMRQMAHYAESHTITVSFDKQDDIAARYIQVDAIGIRRVIMNLLHNAVKFNKHGGTIEISVERSAHVVQVHVKDSGVGIDANDPGKAVSALFARTERASQQRRLRSWTLSIKANFRSAQWRYRLREFGWRWNRICFYTSHSPGD